MCGILFVHSTQKIPQQCHEAALSILQSRGPDLTVTHQTTQIFAAQTVLHITGDDSFYHTPRNDFFAYNGEIYNYRWFGRYSNDVELAYRAAREKPRQFRDFEGAWAWVYINGSHFSYATDPQGERCLYRYQDNDTLILCSEVAPILEYRNFVLKIEPYTTRHWPIQTATPWQGIARVPPGQVFFSTGENFVIDSIFNWSQPTKDQTWPEVIEEFDTVFGHVIRTMTPEVPVAVTFSGGLDSACVAAKLPQANLYTVDCVGKESTAAVVPEFLNTHQQQNWHHLPMTKELWAQECVDLIQRTRMPVQSWSFVGQWHVARHCSQPVLFTGVGADELFGGYEIYKTLPYTTSHSVSPYSNFDPETASSDTLQQWQQCLDFYNGDAAPATLLMDYLTQISAVDMRGVDHCTMAHSIEPRSPFCHPRMIKFALNLPWHYRVAEHSKPLIRAQFLRTWKPELVLPKQGFVGHCNDSYPWLGIDIPRHTDRMQDWKNISQAVFKQWARPQSQTTQG